MVGLLSSVEGGEGAGKGTQVRLLNERLGKEGHTVLLTREPGGTAVGEKIRYLLKHDPANVNMVPQAELMLFMAARAQNFVEVIAPALAEGKVVICDRFIDSSQVYQGVGRKLGTAVVEWLNNYATLGRKPDITFLLDISVDQGFARVGKRPPEAARDRMEEAPRQFYEDVRNAYLAIAKQEKDRFVVIDASRNNPEEIAQEIYKHVADKLASIA